MVKVFFIAPYYSAEGQIIKCEVNVGSVLLW